MSEPHREEMEMMNRRLGRYIPAVVLASTLMTMNADAQKIEQLVSGAPMPFSIEREAALHPLAIAPTADEAFIVVGSSSATKQAWASKVSAQGKVIWTYLRDLQADDQPSAGGRLRLASPAFSGIVPMPNGEAYLCGHMPRSSALLPMSFLARLDAKGKVLSERFLAPDQVDNVVSRYGLDNCTRWADGIAIVGHGEQLSNFDGKRYLNERSFFWVIMLDREGNVRWQKQIPTITEKFNLVAEGVSLIPAQSGLVFSATDNVDTEIVRLNTAGEVQAHRKIGGRYLVVHQAGADETVELFGSTSPTSSSSYREVIVLNSGLAEVRRAQGKSPENFVPRVVYRSRDQSLVLFGSTVHLSGERLRSGAVLVNQSLTAQRSLGFDQEGYFDSGSIWAAAPAKTPGEFIVARSLVKMDDHRKIGAIPPEFNRGAVLNFVRHN